MYRVDLPPAQIAKPLPPNSISKKKAPQPKSNDQPEKKSLKRKRKGAKEDDAPRSFRRLMAFSGGKMPRSGLDDGKPPPKEKKPAKKDVAAAAPAEKEAIPTIRPGERMSEFSARVNAALPLAGLINKSAKDRDPLNLKVWRTKKERKMHKMYDQWREEDQRIKDKREEELELAEEREMDDDSLGVKWKLDLEDAVSRTKKKKGGKRAKYIGETAGAEEDPWEELKRKRGEAKIGLHDVASAPPVLKPIKAKFTVRGAEVNVQDIPKAAGSLRRREELQGVRDDVVASYRKMMESRRAAPKKQAG